MVESLKGKRRLTGYRGTPPVDIKALADTLLAFSALVMDLADHIESSDLNQVIATADVCIVANERIMLVDNNI